MIRRTLLLSLGGIVLISFLFGAYFYRKNLSEMRAIGETCFMQTVNAELEKKQKLLNLPFSSCGVWTDTIPLTIRITTKGGINTFKVDPEKSARNISKIFVLRGIHSVICEESPLSANSLTALWLQFLNAKEVDAEVSIRIAVTDLNKEVLYSFNNGKNYAEVLSSTMFIAYVGNRCEIEVCGFMYSSFKQIIFYHWYPFLWILLGAIVFSSLLYYVYRLMQRLVKVETDANIYQLRPGLLFDTHQQILLRGKEKIRMAPQSSLILKLFLDAPEHTLSYKEIIEGVWKEDKSATIRRFTVASSKLCNVLEKYDCPIDFKRVGTECYRLIFLDDKKNG